MKNQYLYISGLLLFAASGAFAQTGPGGVGSASSNGVWLKADDISQTTGTALSSWADASGNANNADQGNTDYQPNYHSTSSLNSMPVVRLDGTDDRLLVADADILDGTSGIAYFAVVRPSNLNSSTPYGVLGKRESFNITSNYAYTFYIHSSNYLNLDINTNNDRFNSGATAFSNSTNYILGFQFDGSLGSSVRSTIRSAGSVVTTSSETSTSVLASDQPVTLGALNDNYSSYLGADYAEVIHYNYALSLAENNIVNNYLSAKYAISIGANDFYAQDEVANGDFDFNVAGIGQASDGTNHTDSRGSGIVRMNTPSSISNGDYLFWGQDANKPTYSFSTNSSPAFEKLNSSWRVDKTNDLGTVSIDIDITDISLASKSSSDPLLLILDNDSDFSSPSRVYELAVSGNAATASAVSFSDGDYFTIGYGSVSYNGTYNGGSGGSGEPTTADGTKIFFIRSGNATLTADATVATAFITNGTTLNLSENTSLTVNGATIIDGAESLILNSDATGTANFIDNGITYRNSGTARVERYLSGGTTNYIEDYHYISSPVDNPLIFGDMADLYYYDEATLSWVHHTSFTNFSNAVGYAIRYTANITKDFTGELNTGNQTVSVVYNDDVGSSFDHFNLVGNPYSSSISADGVVDGNSAILETTLYFWNGVDYGTYNTSLNAGTAGATGATPDGNISIGQGFYVDSKVGGGTLTFTNSMRGTDSDIFFKQESFPQLRVLLQGENAKSDLLLTGHAASTFGADDYDSKHAVGYEELSLSALINGNPYDIESVPQIETNTFDLQLTATTGQKVRFDLLDLVGLNGKKVFLEDKEAALLVNISDAPYETYVAAGTNKDRFKLRIADEKSSFFAWINNGVVEVIGTEEIPNNVRLISLDGKVIANSSNMRFNNWSGLAKGVYLLEVSTDQSKHIQKIIK